MLAPVSSTTLLCCAYAQVVSRRVEDTVRRKLGESGAGLQPGGAQCAMAPRGTHHLKTIARFGIHFRNVGYTLGEEGGNLQNLRTQTSDKIAACRPGTNEGCLFEFSTSDWTFVSMETARRSAL